ncbi:MAG TPA: SPOR domain-containing protein [Gammaproteobacteria bacterium]|nr:SPOR domain-containing protein [Gammaproteobacteria bacterium]
MNHCSISGSRFTRGAAWIYRSLVLLLLLCVCPAIWAAANLQPSQIPLNNFTLDELQQAADAGDPDAQYALGYMYYYGKGVPQNTQTALNWLKRAAVQGQSQAISAMSLLGQNTPAPQQTMTYVPSQNYAPPTNRSNSARKTSTPGNVNTTVTTTTTLVSETGGQPLSKAQTGHYYTIQLLGASNKDTLNNYINTYHLQGKTTYYQTKHQGKTWYVLVYGNYQTHDEAQAAIASLPAAVRAKKPWVKLIGNAESKPQSKPSAKSASKKTKSTSGKSTKAKTKAKKDEALPF